MNPLKILLVLSGGQDSTTCGFLMRQQFPEAELHAITFDYGQRHARELEAAKKIGELLGVASHEVLELGPVLKGTSPLVSNNELEQYADMHSLPGGLEKTFVPGRNALFLILAANRAAVLGCSKIVTGVCEEDYGGYPDCRRIFIQSLEQAIELGFQVTPDLNRPAVEILTPLMYLTKKATVELAVQIPGCMEALAYSHTSYDGAYPPTGSDHATLLRAKGFYEAGVPDPLVVRAFEEGLMPLPETSNYDALRNRLEPMQEGDLHG